MPLGPHVSAAIVQLRRWVTGSGVALGAAALTQLMVFGFVHFTHVRSGEAAPVEPAALAVVKAQPTPTVSLIAPEGAPAEAAAAPAAPAAPTLTAAQARAVAPPSDWDAYLRLINDAACMVGTVSAAGLLLFALLGVVVAGGSGVPGVEKAVAAAAWSFVIAVACVPWTSLIPAAPWPGAMSVYDAMAAASAAVDAGRLAPAVGLSLYVGLPLLVIAGVAMAVWRFRAGVELGVIITSVSQLDEMLEREMAGVRDRGVGSNFGPRADQRVIGTVNRPAGERPAPPLAVAAGAERMSAPAGAPLKLQRPM